MDLVENTKYHWVVSVPHTAEGYRQAEMVSFLYYRAGQNPFAGSISVDLIGFVRDDVSKFVRTLYSFNPTITQETINGVTAYRTAAWKDGSGEITYYNYFIESPDRLLFSLRFESKYPDTDLDLYKKVMQSFRFTRGVSKLPEKLTLSGNVTELTGNCMPSIGMKTSCSRHSIFTTVYVYPLTKIFGSVEKSLAESSVVAETKANIFGKYSVAVPPGTYSVFLDDNGKKSCGSGDAFGFGCKVTLYEGAENLNLEITHAAF
jgi:hypothetical protein